MQRHNKYVEVGMGQNRQRGYGVRFPFLPGDLYVGVDLPLAAGAHGHDMQKRPLDSPIILNPAEIARLARDDVTMHRIVQPNIRDIEAFTAKRGITFTSIYGDGRSLPIASQSVDGVLFSNVIGDPLLGSECKDELLREAMRVLKIGCLAVTKETITPYVADDYFMGRQWPVQRIGEERAEWPTMQSMYDLGIRGTIFNIVAE